MEGLEEPDSSQCSSDSEGDESPSTSGNVMTSMGNCVKVAESTAQWPLSSEDSISCSSVSDTAEKSQEHMEEVGRDLVDEPLTNETTAQEKHNAAETLKEGEQTLDPQQAVSHLQRLSTVSKSKYC